MEELLDFSQLKKTRKPKKTTTETEQESVSKEAPVQLKLDDNLYQTMLDRLFDVLRQNNPDLAGDKKKQTLVSPIVYKEGTKKTVFDNINDLCSRMRRPLEHMTQYLYAELGTTGSTDANQRLIIKGRFVQKQIESVVRQYVVEYVCCKTCKSLETQMTKENRLFFQKCDACGATKTVAPIKSGFKAQTEKRAATRNAVAAAQQ